jgi:hypothetical protein
MYSFDAEYSYGMARHGELLIGKNFVWNLKYTDARAKNSKLLDYPVLITLV